MRKRKANLLHYLLRHFQMDCEDLRCGDDLISGSPDQQDWSLISGGREGVVLIISHITVSYANNNNNNKKIVSQLRSNMLRNVQ